jgi:hypothetical protein
MQYLHDYKSPKVVLYEQSSFVTKAKANGNEAFEGLIREIGLRALAGYVVQDEKALQTLLKKSEIDDAIGKGNIEEAVYFQLQSQL